MIRSCYVDFYFTKVENSNFSCYRMRTRIIRCRQIRRYIAVRCSSPVTAVKFARNLLTHVYIKYTSISVAHFYAKRLKCAQTWITQFYRQITPCLLLVPSRRTSPPFGWYSFYRPTEGRRLSRPEWLVTYRNKVPPPGVEPGHGHPSQY